MYSGLHIYIYIYIYRFTNIIVKDIYKKTICINKYIYMFKYLPDLTISFHYKTPPRKVKIKFDALKYVDIHLFDE